MIRHLSIAARVTNLNSPVRTVRHQLLGLFVLLPALLLSGHAHAVDAPGNIRLEQNLLLWDEVAGAAKYDIYLLSSTTLNASGTYLTTVVGVSEYELSSAGIYTVVTVTTDGEYSTLDSAGRAVFNDGSSQTQPVTVPNLPISVIRRTQCANVVANTSCGVQCPAEGNYTATGGACRGGAGAVIHQRAQQSNYECLAQNDTSFIEADVYCRRP